MMDMILVGEILVRVFHVLAGINVEVLLLLILDLEEVSLNAILVLSHIGTHNWTVHLTGLSHENALVEEGKTEAVEEFPSLGHLSEATNIEDGLNAEEKTGKPSDTVVSFHGLVEVSHVFSIGDSHVVREQVAFLSLRVKESVEPVETVILNPGSFEPWALGDFGNTAEVTRR